MSAPQAQSAPARGRSESVQHVSPNNRSRSASTSRSSTSTGTYHSAYRHYAATFNNSQTRDVLDSDVDEIDAMLRALAGNEDEDRRGQDEGFIGSRSLSSSMAKSGLMGEVNQTVGEALNALRNSHGGGSETTMDIVIRLALQLMESKRDQVTPAEAVRRDEYIRPIEPSTLASFLTSTLFPHSPLSPVLTSSTTARQCIAYLALEHYYLTQETTGLSDLLHKANGQLKHHETQRAVLEMRCERVEAERDALARLVGEYERRMAIESRAGRGMGFESRVELLLEDQEAEQRGRRNTAASTTSTSRSASPFRSLLSQGGPPRTLVGMGSRGHRAFRSKSPEAEAEAEDQYLLSDLHLSSMQASTRTISQSPLLDLVDLPESDSEDVNGQPPAARPRVLEDTFLAAISAPAASSSTLTALGSEPVVPSALVFPTTTTTAYTPTPGLAPVSLCTQTPSTGFAITMYPQRTRGATLCAYARAVNAAANEVRRLSDLIHVAQPRGKLREARDSGCAEPPGRAAVGLADAERATTSAGGSALCAKCFRQLQAADAAREASQERAAGEATEHADSQASPALKFASHGPAKPDSAAPDMSDVSCACDDDPCFSDDTDSDADSDLMAFPRTILAPFGSGSRHCRRSRSCSSSNDPGALLESQSLVVQALSAPWVCVKRQARRVVDRVKDRLDEWLVV